MSNGNAPYLHSNADESVDLTEVLGRVWRRKWMVVIMVAIASVLSVFYALSLPNVYQAYAVLAPNEQASGDGLSALAAQYSGLASIAGVNLQPSGSTDKVALGLEILKSRKFLADFIVRHDLLVPIMAAKSWDQSTNELVLDPSKYDAASGKWVRSVRQPRKPKPTPYEAQFNFSKNNLVVQQDKKTGFVTVTVTFFSPELASKWVNLLISDLNNTIMQQEVSEAEDAITYLNDQVESTSIADLRNVFYRLIEEQTKTIMLAKVSKEYLLRTLDPATTPEIKAAPKRSVIVLLIVFITGFLGVLLAISLGPTKKN